MRSFTVFMYITLLFSFFAKHGTMRVNRSARTVKQDKIFFICLHPSFLLI